VKTIEYNDTVNKASWERGEWDDEPDKIQWQDEETKLPCLIVRHSGSGHLCGYVGVDSQHPLFEEDDPKLDVHGGITFSNHCHGNICHKVEEGEDDNIWWLGFDCAHTGDYSSMSYSRDHRAQFGHTEDIYRSVFYVRRECQSLARQLKGLEQC